MNGILGDEDLRSAGRSDERRWAVVMFTDMVNSSAIAEEIGSESAYRLMSEIVTIASRAIRGAGGRPLSFGGDSILASFGAPNVLEDAALAACGAALEFCERVKELGPRFEKTFGARPEFRIGISGGLVVLGQIRVGDKIDLNVMGQAVNQAARIQEVANPGQILISGDIEAQLVNSVDTRPLGARSLKGIGEQVNLFEVTGLREGVSRFTLRTGRTVPALSGRKPEFLRLRNHLLRSSDAPRTAVVLGAAGIGKSRLVHKLIDDLGEDVRVLTGQCSAGRQTIPFLPIADVLRRAIGAGLEVPSDMVIQTLRRLYCPDVDAEVLSWLFGPDTTFWPGRSPETVASILRDVLTRLLSAVFDEGPTIIIIEDIQWIDEVSAAVLGELTGIRGPANAKLVLTGREEFTPDWALGPDVLTMRLGPLSEADTLGMAASILGVQQLSPELGALISRKSEGTPLFVAELVRLLRRMDAIRIEGDTALLAENVPDDVADGDLQQYVMHGVDRLSPVERTILMAAAAMGRRFSLAILVRLYGREEVRDAMLAAIDRDLVEPEEAIEGDMYRFTHALLRDAVYSSILEDSRRTLHGRIARAVEAAPPDAIEDRSQALAHHFSLARDPRRAVPYLLDAARRNLRVYSLEKAGELYDRLTEFLDEQPELLSDDEFIRMTLDRLSVLLNLGDSRSVIDLVERNMNRLREASNRFKYEQIISHYSWALSHARRYDEAISLSSKCIEAAKSRGDGASVAWQQIGLLRAYNETLRVDDGFFMEMGRSALAEARRLREPRLEMQILFILSTQCRICGRFEEAKTYCRDLEKLAEEQGEARALSLARWSESTLFQLGREFDHAEELQREAMSASVSETSDFHVAECLLMATLVNGPDPEAARPRLTALREKAEKYLDYNLMDLLDVSRAVLDFRTGKIASGWYGLERLIAGVEKRGNRCHLPVVLLLRAEVRARIAGLVENDEPEKYRVREQPRLGFRDILVAASIRLTAKLGLRRDIRKFLNETPEYIGGAVMARFLICQSFTMSGREAKASTLREAERLAENEGLEFLVVRAQTLLKSIGT